MNSTQPMPAPEPSFKLPALGVQVHPLDNGLDLLFKEERHSPLVSVQIWIKTGSMLEHQWLGSGISHLVEHMLFKGTEKRSYHALASAIQDEGGYVNAYTSFDRTVYWIDAPAEALDACLEILADMVRHSTFPEGEFTKEKEVIRREFAMGKDDPDTESSHLLFETAYREHPVRHPVIGHLSLFNRIERHDAFHYYQERYVPNNAFVVVVGAVDSKDVLQSVQKHLGDWEPKPLPNIPISNEPPQSGIRVAHRPFSTELTTLSLCWHIPSLTHEDAPALHLLAYILGEGDSSRLNQSLHEDLGLAHDISAYAYTPSREGLWIIDAECDADKRETLIDAILHEISKIQQEGASDEELQKALRRKLTRAYASFSTIGGLAGMIGSNWLLTGDPELTLDYLARLQKVTLEEIREVAVRWLKPEKRIVTSLYPGPTPPQATPQETSNSNTQSPQLLLNQRSEPELVTLSNGQNVVLLADHRIPLVSLSLSALGGLLTDTPETSGWTRLYTEVLPKGAGERDASQITLDLESRGGSLSTSTGNNSLGINLGSLSSELPILAQTLGEIIRDPWFDEEEIELERETQISEIKDEHNHLVRQAIQNLKQRMYQDHPYALDRLGSEATLERANSQSLKKLHRQILSKPNTILSLAGSFDRSQAIDLLEASLSFLPDANAFHWNQNSPRPAPDKALISRPEKEQAVLAIAWPGVSVYSENQLALAFLDEALSDMASPLFHRVREELGLAYFVGSGQMIGLSPGIFYLYAGCAPDKVTLVEDVMLNEIKTLAQNGLSEAEMKRTRRTFLAKTLNSRQRVSSLAREIALDVLYGLGLDHHRRLEYEVQTLSNEAVHTELKRFAETPPTVTLINATSGL